MSHYKIKMYVTCRPSLADDDDERSGDYCGLCDTDYIIINHRYRSLIFTSCQDTKGKSMILCVNSTCLGSVSSPPNDVIGVDLWSCVLRVRDTAIDCQVWVTNRDKER